MKKFGIIGFFIALSFCLTAQTDIIPYEQLDTIRAYTDLQQALAHKDEVIKLDLSKHKLDSLPSEVFLFPNLQYLDLRKNKLHYLTADIGKLKKLQYLNLSKNRLDSLPESIGQLTLLRELIASQNYLINLPENIGKLQHLEVLDLWSNDLSDFPETMQQLKALKKVDLRVISLTESEKQRIKRLLSESTQIYFSNGCSCGF